MASITNTRVVVTDIGQGVAPEVTVQVDVNGQQVRFVLRGSAELGLTPAQVTNLQNAMNALRQRAESVTRTAFTIPPP